MDALLRLSHMERRSNTNQLDRKQYSPYT